MAEQSFTLVRTGTATFGAVIPHPLPRERGSTTVPADAPFSARP